MTFSFRFKINFQNCASIFFELTLVLENKLKREISPEKSYAMSENFGFLVTSEKCKRIENGREALYL